MVVTGEGKAFSAGGDLDWIAGQVGNHERTMSVMREAGDIVRTMIECDTPIISAINGVAVGAGLAVALAGRHLDHRPGRQVDRRAPAHRRRRRRSRAAIWPLLCGMAKAKYYLLTSDFIDGREAERIGLVSKAVPADEVLPEALAIAERLALGPRQATLLTKRALNHWLRQALPELRGLAGLRDAQLPRSGRRRGLAALRERRPPEFPR